MREEVKAAAFWRERPQPSASQQPQDKIGRGWESILHISNHHNEIVQVKNHLTYS